jgi:predicted RNase H-like HicB family nuclease
MKKQIRHKHFRYPIRIIWSDEDKCYIATVSELHGVSAHGDTPWEAAKEVLIAADGVLEVMKEDGDKIPEPQRTKKYSGQIRLRMPPKLHEALSIRADREGVSLNRYMVRLLLQSPRSK